MTITTLDPHVALVVIDLQKGITQLATVHPMGEVLERASALATAFRDRQLTVVLVNVVGGAPGRTEQTPPSAQRPSDWSELVPELGQQPEDILISKSTWGAFTGTALEATLRERGVTNVVLCGVATSIGVESTARQAYELGFNVTIARDALTDRDSDAHHNSVERIFPRLAETGTTTEIIDLLATLGHS
ncbi:MAG: isochorismatase family protein [Acidobacteria bacterium]|nr:isochorismatase family protein [Acidobacteriota bacterium]